MWQVGDDWDRRGCLDLVSLSSCSTERGTVNGPETGSQAVQVFKLDGFAARLPVSGPPRVDAPRSVQSRLMDAGPMNKFVTDVLGSRLRRH